MKNFGEILRRGLAECMSVEETNLGFEVACPSIYANGDSVMVIVKPVDGKIIIHDGGAGIGAVYKDGMELSKKAVEHITDFSSKMGCHFSGGRIMRDCDVENIVGAALTVASASQFASAQVRAPRVKKDDFEAKVLAAMIRQQPRFIVESKTKLVGWSGRSFTITAQILNNQRRPLAFIDAVASSRSVDHTFREMFELSRSEEHQDVQRIVVWNSEEKFPNGDLSLLQQKSNLVSYDDFDKRLDKLVAA